MKVYVKCDRCGTFAEGNQDYSGSRIVGLPSGWSHMRFFPEPYTLNGAYPEGGATAELCGTCTPIVEEAARASIRGKVCACGAAGSDSLDGVVRCNPCRDRIIQSPALKSVAGG